MTLQTLKVLKVLLENPAAEHYGLEISKGADLPTGSIYPILARLELVGWVESAWENIDEHAEGRRRRRYYRLTDDGAERAKHKVLEAQDAISPTRGRPGGFQRPGESPA